MWPPKHAAVFMSEFLFDFLYREDIFEVCAKKLIYDPDSV